MPASAPRGDHAQFRVSSFCTGGGCVGIAGDDVGVVLVDTKVIGGPRLRLRSHEWAAFVAGVKAAAFSLPEAHSSGEAVDEPVVEGS